MTPGGAEAWWTRSFDTPRGPRPGRRVVGGACLGLILGLVVGPAEAHHLRAGTPLVAEKQVLDRIANKLETGVLNLMTGWLEVPHTIGRQVRSLGPVVGPPIGVVEGTIRGALRTLAGVYDIVTFYLPIPAHFRPVMESRFGEQIQ